MVVFCIEKLGVEGTKIEETKRKIEMIGWWITQRRVHDSQTYDTYTTSVDALDLYTNCVASSDS